MCMYVSICHVGTLLYWFPAEIGKLTMRREGGIGNGRIKRRRDWRGREGFKEFVLAQLETKHVLSPVVLLSWNRSWNTIADFSQILTTVYIVAAMGGGRGGGGYSTPFVCYIVLTLKRRQHSAGCLKRPKSTIRDIL
jgi:hypothetical protein